MESSSQGHIYTICEEHPFPNNTQSAPSRGFIEEIPSTPPSAIEEEEEPDADMSSATYEDDRYAQYPRDGGGYNGAYGAQAPPARAPRPSANYNSSSNPPPRYEFRFPKPAPRRS
ncbi:hypothetical protein TWF481_009227 [Arthrobotrys musiformis]|uniref:Uncharacterized protein n=1 Tax=Arthrobotrys musiformis TaxID=47236 RepID=A0AAV9W5A0_9PEZI